MNPQTIRNLALELLDTDTGITTHAWIMLEEILREYEMLDIIQGVKTTECGDFYLPYNADIFLKREQETGKCPVCHTLWNSHSEMDLEVCRREKI